MGKAAVHELALMDAVQRLAEREVRRQGASRIHRLQLRIGSLAGWIRMPCGLPSTW